MNVRGMTPAAVLRALSRARTGDAQWARGRTWSLVYHASDAHVDHLVEAYRLFYNENALSPPAFPSLARLAREVVTACAELVGGGARSAGSMTSGGTESILLAVKTHRDWFRARHRRAGRPEMVLPASAHPAFHKAAQYFDVTPVTVPLGADYRLDPAAVARAVTSRTALVVASAPSFPYGMVDPIPALGRIARRHGAGLHVDACLGGMFLPFMRRLGHDVPPFDFSVPGVTSISTDLHKYGFAPKGSSVLLFRNAAIGRFQAFAQDDWPGGAYESRGLLGTRPGGIIAAAWAALMLLGEEGYCALVRDTLTIRDQLMDGLRSAGFEILGQPDMAVFAFTSSRHDMFAVAAALERRGWWIDRLSQPASIHLVVTPNHTVAAGEFLRDLRAVAPGARTKAGRSAGRPRVGLYGVTTRPGSRGRRADR